MNLCLVGINEAKPLKIIQRRQKPTTEHWTKPNFRILDWQFS